MHKQCQKLILILIPFAVIFWLIGWSLYSIGEIIVEKKRQQVAE